MVICLAGVEGFARGDKLKNILNFRTRPLRDTLCTYFYLSEHSKQTLIGSLQKLRCYTARFLMLDSGAYTLKVNITGVAAGKRHVAKSENKINVQQYTDSYIKFVQKTHRLFDVIIEMDLDDVMGYEWVKQVRSRLVEIAGPEKIMPVYHDSLPNRFSEFDKWTNEFKYIGVGGKPSSDTLRKLFALNLDTQGKLKSRIHGLAFVEFNTLTQFPFWSADSTSWLSSQKFGNTTELINNLLRSVTRTERKKFIESKEKGVVAGPLKLHLTDFVNNPIVASYTLAEAAEHYEKFADTLTYYWEWKGVVWPELQKS